MTAPGTAGGAPGVLLVLDGWGQAPPAADNALASADTPVLDGLRTRFPATLADASGEAVGLLPGTVGNSEIGHLVIGAGRPLPYDSLLVQQQIDSGALRTHQEYTAVCAELARRDRALHLIGLCSDGQIHAQVEHLPELLAVAATRRVPRVYVHAITDGRDVPDGSAPSYLRRVQEMARAAGVGRIATVMGRGFALDKAGNLDLTDTAVRVIADGSGALVSTATQAVGAGVHGDEWVTPSAVTDASGNPVGAVADGDAILFFNFRSDRIQQLADLLLTHLGQTRREVRALSLAQYDTRAAIPPLVGRADASGGLADALGESGLRSVRIAEAEKFEHVTYYLNGRDATRRPGEEHVRVTGDGKPDYRANPQMCLDQVTRAVSAAVGRPEVDLVIANLANIDVVGHTGDFAATVLAAEHTDVAVSRIVDAAAAAGRWVLLVGDHGNAECMTRPGPDGSPRPYGGHTTNPVPVVVVPAPGAPPAARPAGRATLADIAPTVLSLLGRRPGAAMTGSPLL